MSLRRLWLACAVLVAANLALLLWPARRSSSVAAPSSSVAARPRARVGLVLDVGGLGDKSFNDAAWRGLERARRELGVEVELVEPGDGGDRESALRLLVARGFDLVMATGFIFSDDIYALAQENPRVHFACLDYAKFDAGGFVIPPENLVALKFREEQGAFLVGAVAALTSRSQVVGFVGGMDIPLIHKFEAGYRAGALHVCPGCRVVVGYAGVTGDAFKNPSKGKELALAQYAEGADVIFHASGSTGLGVFEAARSTGRWAIGVDADQWDEAPGRVLTSMTKGIDVAVLATVKRQVEGGWTGGVRTFGLEADGVDYVFDDHNRALLPSGARERVEALRAEVVAGRITVPSERGAR